MAQETEVKVSAATLGATAASIGLALLNALAADSSLLGGLPAWLQFVLVLAIPPVITYVSGFVTPSATSTVSNGYKRPVA